MGLVCFQFEFIKYAETLIFDQFTYGLGLHGWFKFSLNSCEIFEFWFVSAITPKLIFEFVLFYLMFIFEFIQAKFISSLNKLVSDLTIYFRGKKKGHFLHKTDWILFITKNTITIYIMHDQSPSCLNWLVSTFVLIVFHMDTKTPFCSGSNNNLIVI